MTLNGVHYVISQKRELFLVWWKFNGVSEESTAREYMSIQFTFFNIYLT
jgi:hypothetical protein